MKRSVIRAVINKQNYFIGSAMPDDMSNVEKVSEKVGSVLSLVSACAK